MLYTQASDPKVPAFMRLPAGSSVAYHTVALDLGGLAGMALFVTTVCV